MSGLWLLLTSLLTSSIGSGGNRSSSPLAGGDSERGGAIARDEHLNWRQPHSGGTGGVIVSGSDRIGSVPASDHSRKWSTCYALNEKQKRKNEYHFRTNVYGGRMFGS